MALTDITTILLMTVGFLFILVVVYFVYKSVSGTRSNSRHTSSSSESYPPSQYMRTQGVQCPDYFVYSGVKDGKVVCKNTFNIPVNNPETCLTNNEVEFPEIQSWPVNSNDIPSVLKERCKWVKECGAKKHQPASWLGVAQHC